MDGLRDVEVVDRLHLFFSSFIQGNYTAATVGVTSQKE